jgi:mono/diheme cytochrome c family protein
MGKLMNSMLTVGFIGITMSAYSQMGMMGPGNMMGRGNGAGPGNGMGMSMLRHHYLMMNGIGPQYASKVNPLQPTTQNIKSGEKLFEQNCARCHGQTGVGDGPDGQNLSPPPANIAAVSKMPMATDGYLYWTISEGGAPVGSAMPPFKNQLKENEIWEIITYLRAL